VIALIVAGTAAGCTDAGCTDSELLRSSTSALPWRAADIVLQAQPDELGACPSLPEPMFVRTDDGDTVAILKAPGRVLSPARCGWSATLLYGYTPDPIIIEGPNYELLATIPASAIVEIGHGYSKITLNVNADGSLSVAP